MSRLSGSTVRQEHVDTKVTVAGVREWLVTTTVIWTRAPCAIAPNFHTSGEKVMEGALAAWRRPDDSRRAARMTGSEARCFCMSGLDAFPNRAEKPGPQNGVLPAEGRQLELLGAHRLDEVPCRERPSGAGPQVQIGKRDRPAASDNPGPPFRCTRPGVRPRQEAPAAEKPPASQGGAPGRADRERTRQRARQQASSQRDPGTAPAGPRQCAWRRKTGEGRRKKGPVSSPIEAARPIPRSFQGRGRA